MSQLLGFPNISAIVPLLQFVFVPASIVSHYENIPIRIYREFKHQKMKIFR